MEKKDWKQRLGSYDSWAMNESMFITIDGETIYTLDKLLDFIQQELDKAREEVITDVFKAGHNEMYDKDGNRELLKLHEYLCKKYLSKLKDNK